MSDPTDVKNCLERMKIYMELRGLRPMTVYTFAGYARRFLAHVGKTPAALTAADVESFVLDQCRKGRAAFFSPRPIRTLPLVFRAPKFPGSPRRFLVAR